MNISAALCVILLGWNIVTFILMGTDKSKAVKAKRRIRERTLFIAAFLLGAIGIMAGMYLFRHKTKHRSFRIFVPVAIITNIIVCCFLFHLLLFMLFPES